MNNKITLRHYQQVAVDKTITALSTKKGNAVIVAPTGAGKSHILANICFHYFFKDKKILVLAHNKEVLTQNEHALSMQNNASEVFQQKKVGMYCSALKRSEIADITLASIQSVYLKAELFKKIDTVIIDECHLINNKADTMYKRFFDQLNSPKMLGLTATPFRLKGGSITNSASFFDYVSYSISLDTLIEEKHLVPLITLCPKNKFSWSEKVKTTAGEYNLKSLSDLYNKDFISSKIADDLTQYKKYKHMLIFCIDINHAENVSALLNKNGISSVAVHSKSDRSNIDYFTSGKVQACCNVNILTTGFDFNAIDLIVILRPTKSPVLHVQMLGRGMRTHEDKTNCLVLDYASNLEKLGFPGHLKVEGKAGGGGGGGGEMPLKACPKCYYYNFISAKECVNFLCKHTFKFKHGLSLLSELSDERKLELEESGWKEVTMVQMRQHRARSGNTVLKVLYEHNNDKFFDYYVCLGTSGAYADKQAKKWLKAAWAGDIKQEPKNMEALLDEVHKNRCTNFHLPTHIKTEKNGKFINITKFNYEQSDTPRN